MATEVYSGTEAISTTEHSLVTDTAGPDTSTTAGTYQAFLDLSDMVAGDELQIRIYEKVRSGDTQRIIYQSNLVGAQANPIWVSPVLTLMHGWDFTLDAIAGTITVNWSIRDTAPTIPTSDITAIKAKTDSLTFTVADNLDVNIQYVNDVAVTGTGAEGSEWGP